MEPNLTPPAVVRGSATSPGARATTRLLVAGLVLAAIVLSAPGEAQIQGNATCQAAKVWHLQQAMKVTLTDDQAYHLGAAQAAQDLSAMSGEPCAGWKDWATGRSAAVEP